MRWFLVEIDDVEEEEEPGRKRRVDFAVVTGLSELALASRSVGDSRSDPEAAVGGRISLLLRFTKELNVVHELLREALDKGAFWEMGLLEPFVGGSLFLDFVRRSMESGFEFWGKDDQLSLLLRFEVVMRRGKRRAEEGELLEGDSCSPGAAVDSAAQESGLPRRNERKRQERKPRTS